jgi:CubicO group peptidase (beta-lactamase class C family)
MRDISRLLSEAPVPAAAIAVVRTGRPAEYVCCGVRGVQRPEQVDEHTVFEAASLTKPVFAHAVLQLADRGALSLTEPLGSYLPDYVAMDPRASSVTAADVLSHSAGFPNWRNAEYPLKTYFGRGERFSYSGEGYLYLQRAVERITGETIDALAERLVLGPFSMPRSSFVWHPRLGANRALPHDAFGKPALNYKPGEPNAAWSLQTTAADFARFLAAVLAGERLADQTAGKWLSPHIEVTHEGIQSLGPREPDVRTGIAWGLGWGLEIDAGTFFHWGDNGPFTAFTTGSRQEQSALVIFTNGASGLSIMPELVAHFVPGDRPSLVWLDYVRHDSAVRTALRSALANGIEQAWPALVGAALTPSEMRWIAQGLRANGREGDSAWLQAKADAAR